MSEQINAVLGIYGPRTTALLFNPVTQQVQELTLIEGKWILSHQALTISPKTKLFSPGNLRAVTENEHYRKVVDRWIHQGYTLRYTGGLVPDAAQLFIKGHGVFCNAASKSHKPKLRVLYEVAAIGYLIEKAGGATIKSGGGSVLDYEVEGYDDRM